MSDSGYLGEKQQTRDLSQYFRGMSGWIARRFAELGPAQLLSMDPTPASAGGFAGETFLLDVNFGSERREENRRFVLKRKPTKHLYFPDHDFDAEAKVQKLLSTRKEVPIAPFLGYECDTSILGSPFYLLGFVTGRPAPDQPVYYEGGWIAELPAHQQRAVCIETLSALAKIHAVPFHEAGANFLKRAAPGQSQLDWDLARWDRFCLEAWRGPPADCVIAGREWLEANKPNNQTLVISWGDARPGNILFQDTEAVAVLDWDLVTCGDPEMDLGYLLSMDRVQRRFAELGSGINLDGWPNREEMIQIYEELSGRSVDIVKFKFYRVLAGYAIACMYARYLTMRTDLDEKSRNSYLDKSAPPIEIILTEMNE